LLIPLSEATAGSSGTLILRGTVPLTGNIATVQADNIRSGPDDSATPSDGARMNGTSMTFSRIDSDEEARPLESGKEVGTTLLILQAN